MSAHLTAKQNAFALGIVGGIPATTAYRQAYDADGMKPESVWVESCRLATNPKVALRVSELRAEQEEERRMLRLSHAEAVLERLEHEALEAKTDSTRVRALELIGRHLGMFTDKVEITTQERSVEMIEQEIRDRLVRFGFLPVSLASDQ
jgi:phage terminase small subunit